MRTTTDMRDAALWDLFHRQHGLARLKQALEVSSKKRIETLIRHGSLIRVEYGILGAAGAPDTPEKEESLGLLVASPRVQLEGVGAALCNLSSALRLDLCDDVPPEIHVMSTRWMPPREGFKFHRTSRMPMNEIIVVDGFPITDGPRTFLDVCATDPWRAKTMYRRGLRRKVFTREQIEDRIDNESRQGRTGLSLARAILGSTDPTAPLARSGLEDVFFDRLIALGYPAPLRNFRIRGTFGWEWEIDLYYPQVRKGFEVSPTDTHGRDEMLILDSRKLFDLKSLGIDIVPVTEATTQNEFDRLAQAFLGPQHQFPRAYH